MSVLDHITPFCVFCCSLDDLFVLKRVYPRLYIDYVTICDRCYKRGAAYENRVRRMTIEEARLEIVKERL